MRAPIAIVLGGVVVAGVLAVVLAMRSPERAYPQASPDDVIRAAVEMIKRGDTRRLTTLLYAETPEMRQMYNQLGLVLEAMQRLSVACAKRFPQDFERLQADALAAAEDPKNKTLVSQLVIGMGELGAGNGTGRPPNADDVKNAFSAILADPFGWVDRNAARLTAVKTADDTASVMFDGQPAIPVVGLPMRLDNGRWYFNLPLSVPPMSSVMPRTRQQWQIMGSIMKVLENSMNAARQDVEGGRVMGLKNLTDEFQDKALLNILLAAGPYMKEMDVRGRTDRRLAALRTRQRAWMDAKKKAAPKGATAVSPKVLEAIASVAPGQIEKIVRANKPLAVDKTTDAEFEELVGGWLASEGLRIKMDGELAGDGVERSIQQWREQRASAAGGKPAKKP